MDLERLSNELSDVLRKHGVRIERVLRDDSIHLDCFPNPRHGDGDYVKPFDKMEVTVIVKGRR